MCFRNTSISKHFLKFNADAFPYITKPMRIFSNTDGILQLEKYCFLLVLCIDKNIAFECVIVGQILMVNNDIYERHDTAISTIKQSC